MAGTGSGKRICLVFDCLYPHTIGGAERWYRNLSEQLAAGGYEVTYLTLRQWEQGADPGVAGVEIVPVGPRMALYTRGRRRVWPALVFGAGILWHLFRHGRRYDVVHTAATPYFSLLAAAAVRPIHRFRLLVDWFEVWTQDYWREYLGALGGYLGWAVQRFCARIPHQAFCFSRIHAARLREQGFGGTMTILEGLYAGTEARPGVSPAEPVIVFAGRHIPEKRVPALVHAFVRAREQLPELRCEIYGDGPDRREVLRLIDAYNLNRAAEAPGFVDGGTIIHAFRRALCMVLPSRREGYGMVVVEASALGTPSVVVRDPDNAATELVEDGHNGVLADSASPDDLAAAILRVHNAGPALRASTRAWFERNSHRLSLEHSLQTILDTYARGQ